MVCHNFPTDAMSSLNCICVAMHYLQMCCHTFPIPISLYILSYFIYRCVAIPSLHKRCQNFPTNVLPYFTHKHVAISPLQSCCHTFTHKCLAISCLQMGCHTVPTQAYMLPYLLYRYIGHTISCQLPYLPRGRSLTFP